MRARTLALLLLLSLAGPLRAATDAFGYQSGDPGYSWVNFTGTVISPAAWVGGADDGYVQIDLPFNFRFYGSNYSKIYIASNGYLQFGTASSYFGTNCLGANATPLNIIAAYWMDLDPGLGGTVQWQVQGGLGSHVVLVEFNKVPPHVGSNDVTFQIELRESDRSIELRYLSTSGVGSGANAVAGIRSQFDCPNHTSLPFSCNQALLGDLSAVRFSYPVPEPACGTPTTSPTFSVSPTISVTPSITATATPTSTATETLTSTGTPSDSPTASVSPTGTVTPTLTATASQTLTFTNSPTASVTATATPSGTRSPTFTVSSTWSASPTLTQSPTISPSFSVSPTWSVSPTITESHTESPTWTASPSFTETPSVTESYTPSPSLTDSPTLSPSWTASPSHSPTSTRTPSVTRTDTPTMSPTRTNSPTRTATGTWTASPTITLTWTPSATPYPPAPRPACLVLGQTSFGDSSSAALPAGLNSPQGMVLDTRSLPYRVYVADTLNHRVLYWNDAQSLVNGATPDGVLGQANLTSASPNRGGSVGANTLSAPMGLTLDLGSGDLWVADSANHRVLRYSAPVSTGSSATLALGQGGSLNTASPNLGGVSASSLNAPVALHMDSLGRLAVADSGNLRALVYSAPASSGAADLVFGQADLSSASVQTATASSLGSPSGVLLTPSRLWVADSGFHRVLAFPLAPVVQASASLLLGQADLSSSLANRGEISPSASTLYAPRGLSMDPALRLFVSDSGNHRILAFDPPYDVVADVLYGQNYMSDGLPWAGNGSPYNDALKGPASCDASALGTLLVADSGTNRALLFGCGAVVGPATATPSVTPSVTRSSTATVTPTRSPTPTITETHTRTPSRTVTSTHSFSPTPSVSWTATLSFTVTRTFTRTPTPSVTRTLTVTLTPIPSQTPYPHPRDRAVSYPNPVQRGGQACLAFPAGGAAQVWVYDMLGQPVRHLDGALVDAAKGFACWDLRRLDGGEVAPGIYYWRVLVDGQAYLCKMTVQ